MSSGIFEANLGDTHLYDVSSLMPRRKWKQKLRDVEGVDSLFIHHSGRLGRPGLQGALNSAKYMVNNRKFPGPGYTFWIPAAPVYTTEGYFVVYRLNPDEYRSWHTGNDANDRGVSICFQGNTTKQPLTEYQKTAADDLVMYCLNRYPNIDPVTNIRPHSQGASLGGRDKKQCPGKSAEAWLEAHWVPNLQDLR